ncbi:sister chromatid cohesion C-terminus-domain-containing protein [Zychaea mexicana]|uniref:sister chromatid cohesion C-terminus-domain-containing protein n=1 Tax=Zychaea mexicana TaxID=64656 RepID=UPI0022FE48B5|nr:sister chromatid cohesion C-terminus-domain-containing protein [Zychaea mexicana]KAI9494015.1 sister chromatid cohesion C-terminus-domain-containing protein [Zychaea mexicana]
MEPSKKQGQKSKPLRAHEDNKHPTKKRRVITASEKRAAVLKKLLQQSNNDSSPAPATATNTTNDKTKDDNSECANNNTIYNSDSNSSDEEDDIPLTRRRAFTQKQQQQTPSPLREIESPLRRMQLQKPSSHSTPRTEKKRKAPPRNHIPSPEAMSEGESELESPLRIMEIDQSSSDLKDTEPSEKIPPPPSRARSTSSSSPPPDNSIDEEQRRHVQHEKGEDSFEKRGEVALAKLSAFVDIILERLDNIDDDGDDSNAVADDKNAILTIDDPPLLQPSTMQKFTALALKAAQYRVVTSNIDLIPKIAQIIRSMEQHCVQAMELQIISTYAKARESKTGYAGIVKMLDRIVSGLEAAAMIVDLYSVCKIDKQHLPENLVLTCMQYVRSQLDNTIYPLIDLNGFEEDATSLNNDARAFLRFVEATPVAKNHLSRMLPLVTHLFCRISNNLLPMEGLDDHGIIVLCYIALGAFFHDYTDENHSCLVKTSSTTGGDTIINPYEQMKMAALDVLRLLFNKYPQHRKWILSEILTSLNSLTTMDRTVKRYRLRGGSGDKIHVMSALLMQLVQCCTITADMEDHRQWLRKWELRYQKVRKEGDSAQIQDLQQKMAQKTVSFWKSGIDAATESASYLLEHLVSKCKSRKRDSYSVAEYRAILESTLNDMLLVLGKPEWPAAELLLQVLSVILTSKLKSRKSELYLKSLAIDWLGIISCRIKAGIDSVSGGTSASLTPKWIYELYEKLPSEINSTTSPDVIDLLHQCHMKLYEHFDQPNDTARQFHLCAWGFSYASCWTKATQKNEQEWGSEIQEALQVNMGRTFYLSVAGGISGRYPEQWASKSSLFEFPEMSWADLTLLSELLVSRNTLYKSFNMFLAEIMECFHSDVATYRNKAVKAIRHIANGVPEILDESRIRIPIIQRIHDSSPSVRDAAVEVLAKYLGRQTDVPRKLYDIVSMRIMDTAINVRKRVIKLLRELYSKCSDEELKIDIASKLILRISDSEVGISDLALKMSQEVLFFPFQDIDKDDGDYFGSSYDNAPKARKERIKALTNIITGAASRIEGGKTTALSQIVQKTLDTSNDKSRIWFEKVFQWIIDCLFQSMMAHDEAGEMREFKYCLVTAHSFIKVCPDLLRETQMTALQPYLSVSEQDDWPLARHVLNIYEDVLPRIKYHDPDFIALIERVLIQLVGTSPLEVTASTVSCLCAIVGRISHHYGILVRILGSCIVKLRGLQKVIREKSALDRPATNATKLLAICGLLCQYFDFDGKRKEDPEKMKALDKITEGTIDSTVFKLLFWYTDKWHQYADNTSIRLAALQSLGYLFMRYPTLITTEACLELMDDIFDNGSVMMQTRLMKVYYDFLASEENRLKKNEEVAGASLYTKEIDVNVLLGNTAEFAELGVNGSLMQRYLGKILECSINDSGELRYAAYEVISVVMRQGLAHPVLCMPAIFAAETSPDSALRHKAYYLHRFAHDKYGTLLYTHFPQYFTKAFQYQKLHAGITARGYRISGGDTKFDALFGLTFSIIKQKKKPKVDFLSSLLKPFKFDLKETTVEEVDVYYLRFLADNVIALELTQSDEVFHLLYHISRIQATSCADLVSYIQYMRKNNGRSENSNSGRIDQLASKSAIAMYILLRIKASLKDLYGISDSDIAEFDPNENRKARAISKIAETDYVIDWADELQFFQENRLDETTATDAYDQFELLAMATTTAEEEEEDDDDDEDLDG